MVWRMDRVQNLTSADPARREECRFETKERHSLWQDAVMFSPFQAEGMWVPCTVHPGQEPLTAQYRRGHSKLRWVRLGKARAMLHMHGLPIGTDVMPKLSPTTRGDKGFPVKSWVVRGVCALGFPGGW